ncbi:MAG: phosphoribosylamine--glycine ligase, partial [Bdellovibrionales bacterium]|nr:phosphoribosylamine--glycine ligase [Bdellovibrionales bacterium]
MKILLIGSGGREAALAWKICKSTMVNELIVSPGNPGMKKLSDKIKLKKINQRDEYLALKPDLVIIGPEAPLTEGLTDFFELNDVLVAAPSQAAARLEGSKDFCKEIFKEAG